MTDIDWLQCIWTETWEGVWETECGESAIYDKGTPDENRQRFCGHCGRIVSAVLYHDDDDIEEDVNEHCNP